ncbi:hypothetical protein MEX01_51400 [Methylorubrum extorquens]|uniref:hypothetical protein n=1 Tax=Methylorubrum extorquens TaxID=408 RepID=UPI0011710E3F|nr:hypothetical protein [Methylorubrum extorquens]GEL44549.1 hypothetical protein MEX01_51400 [Methylorubrum extorquens]
MVKLKLRGKRAAYDEIITQAGKSGIVPERIVGDLMAAQLPDVESRATAYRMNESKRRAGPPPLHF